MNEFDFKITDEVITKIVEGELLKAKIKKEQEAINLYTDFLKYSCNYDDIPVNLLRDVMNNIFVSFATLILRNWNGKNDHTLTTKIKDVV